MITLQCKMCGSSMSSGKCSSCGSHTAVEKSLYETPQMLKSRLTGHEYYVSFAPLEKPGVSRPQDHEPFEE